MRRVALCAVLVVALTGCAGMVTVEPVGELRLDRPAQTSVVQAADGTVLASLHGEQDRDVVALARVPRVLREAVVAVEDVRFYEHVGVDARALGRAIVTNAAEGHAAQGGSTITQQLAKLAVVGNERSVTRKLSEAAAALALERQMSKDEILEAYLNTAYFGAGAYGVQTAARRYFGVDVEDLGLAQSALLAGLLRAPSRTDPFTHPTEARTRRDLVLELMARQGRADAAAAAAAQSSPLGVIHAPEEAWRAPYFVAHTIALLQHDRSFGVLGADPRERADRLLRGGLVIETTLDVGWQDAAEQAVADTLPERDDPRAALVAIDPSTGHVRALVGGRDYDDPADASARFNLAVEGRRQAASTFKPLVLAAALGRGAELDEVFPGGATVTVPVPGARDGWQVTNNDDRDHGPVTLAEATAQSVNTVYARLIDRVGAQAVADLARAAGTRRELAPLPSLALGAAEVSVLEMASVQATFAAGGVYRPPTTVTRITGPDGEVLFEAPQAAGERVVDPRVATEVTSALRGVVEQGTGRRADLRRPTAGKTGTSQDGADAWFVGYTPDLAAAVWVGFPEGRVGMTPPRTRTRVQGGTWPAELFARFGMTALAGSPARDFPPPAGHPAEVTVPGVVGLDAEAAAARLSSAGLEVVTRPQHSPTLPPGYALRQEPQPGTERVASGTPVTLWVSSADRAEVTVPDVLGRDVAAARAALEDAGFVVEVEVGCPDASDDCAGAALRPDGVWQQSPDPAAAAVRHSVVRLDVYPDR